MVSTILAVIQIGVEGGAISKISEVRFLMRGLAISPPRFSKFCERANPPEFSKKKLAGNLELEPLVWDRHESLMKPVPIVWIK